jgi:hypothetical protein
MILEFVRPGIVLGWKSVPRVPGMTEWADIDLE